MARSVNRLLALFIACAWTAFFLPAAAQDIEKQATSPELFSNINVGFGLPYGGIGLNAELGAGHFSSFAGFGFAPKRSIDTLTIKPTLNYLLGFRYYFDVKSNIIYPRIGAAFGWVTNYYNSKIGNESYSQKVNGLSIQVGTQFYSTEGVVLSIDLVMSSKYLIVSADSHPHFYSFYIRPAIGVGIDISGIKKKKKKAKTIKNDRIDPLQ